MAFVIGSTSLNTWLNKPISWSPRTNTCVPKCVVLCARAVTLNNHDSSDQRAVIALDVGTSSIKSALYFIDSDADQKAVPKLGQVFRRPHQTTVGEPGVLTQKPDDWYDGAILAMRDVVRHQQSSTKIVAISVTGEERKLCHHFLTTVRKSNVN